MIFPWPIIFSSKNYRREDHARPPPSFTVQPSISDFFSCVVELWLKEGIVVSLFLSHSISHPTSSSLSSWNWMAWKGRDMRDGKDVTFLTARKIPFFLHLMSWRLASFPRDPWLLPASFLTLLVSFNGPREGRNLHVIKDRSLCLSNSTKRPWKRPLDRHMIPFPFHLINKDAPGIVVDEIAKERGRRDREKKWNRIRQARKRG